LAAQAAAAEREAHGDAPAAAQAAPAGPVRMVEYFAKSCPHCRHLEPVWQDAKRQWATEAGATASGEAAVKWEQKECFTDGWKKGPDFDECQKEHVHAFPTIKLYDGSAGAGHAFEGDRTPQQLVDFVRTQTAAGKKPGLMAHVKALPSPTVQTAASPWLLPPPPERDGRGSCLGRRRPSRSAAACAASLQQPASLALFL